MNDKQQEDFLYNTLNTIYAVNIKGEQKANELLLAFSEFIRFKNHKIDLRRISIAEECEHLEKFLFIEQIRKEKLQYSLNLNTCETRKIPPFFVIDCVNLLLSSFFVAEKHTLDITFQCNTHVKVTLKTSPIQLNKKILLQKIDSIIQRKVELNCRVSIRENSQHFILKICILS